MRGDLMILFWWSSADFRCVDIAVAVQRRRKRAIAAKAVLTFARVTSYYDSGSVRLHEGHQPRNGWQHVGFS